MAGTREDAALVVQLARWGAEIGLSEALRTIFADEFDTGAADVSDAAVQPVLLFFETVGTLVKNELLDRALTYDWLWVSGAWAKVGPAATRAREKVGVAQLYENFEALAAGQGF
jgi:hypothetical protein